MWILWLSGCLINSALKEERHRELSLCERPEICNGRDDDCDGAIDDEDIDLDIETAPQWHLDGDGDGYGTAQSAVRQCVAPPLYVEDATDCDDTEASAHPGSTQEDLPYDGIDTDCDHHNDFDQDGDCFMPPGLEVDYESYVQRVYGEAPPPFCVDPEQPFGDCLDAPSAAIALDPSLAHPSTEASPADDPPYDGLDQDCAANNDYDADSDGFMPGQPPETDALLAQYAAAWGYEALLSGWASLNPDAGLVVPGSGDCDDLDAESWPGAVERLADGTDQDCAGDGDASAFGYGDALPFEGLSNPEVALIGDQILVMITAESGGPPVDAVEYGFALLFGASARGGEPPSSSLTWRPGVETLEVQPILDVEAEQLPEDIDGDGIDDPSLWAALVKQHATVGYTYVGADEISLRSLSGVVLAGNTTTVTTASYTARGLDVAVGDERQPLVIACAEGWMHAMYGLEESYETGDPYGGDTCFFSSLPAPGSEEMDFVACVDARCSDGSLTEGPEIVEGQPLSERWVFGDRDGSLIGLVDGDGLAYVQPVGGLPEALPVPAGAIDVDTAEAGGIRYAAAVLDEGVQRSLWIAYGTEGAMSAVELPVNAPDTSAILEHASIAASADRIAIAVTLSGDGGELVGWVFLAP